MELWQRGGYENGMDIPEVGAWSVVAAGEESQTINESVTWPDGYISLGLWPQSLTRYADGEANCSPLNKLC